VIYELIEDLIFPDPFLAEEDGLLAVGGDLKAERLKLAYRMGIFPWYSEGEPILWYAPPKRFVIFPNEISISKSLSKTMSKNIFKISMNTVFKTVIDNCAKISRVGQSGTWITNEMKEAYCKLHDEGIALSVEVWKGEELIGGLYGVNVGNVFCGESMFHKEPDASKIALVYLCQNYNFQLIDCQMHTNHLERMGGRFVSLEEYLKVLHS
jgi:leucyl/phenylalanyl-tRNA--protein transferase